LFVCLAHAGDASTLMIVGSWGLQRQVAQGLYVFWYQFSYRTSHGNPLVTSSNETGVDKKRPKNAKFPVAFSGNTQHLLLWCVAKLCLLILL